MVEERTRKNLVLKKKRQVGSKEDATQLDVKPTYFVGLKAERIKGVRLAKRDVMKAGCWCLERQYLFATDVMSFSFFSRTEF